MSCENSPGLVTLEHLSIIVRFHDEPTKFGDSAVYNSGFVLHQTEPNVYEAKLAINIKFGTDHQRELMKKMVCLGAKRVDLWRHKKGKDPYVISIHANGKIKRGQNEL